MLRNGKRIVNALEMAESAIRICVALGAAGYAAYTAVDWWLAEGGSWCIETLESSSKRSAILLYASSLGCKFNEYVRCNGIKFPLGKVFVVVPNEAGISIRGVQGSNTTEAHVQVRGYDPAHIDAFIARAVAYKKSVDEALDRTELGMYVYNTVDGFARHDLAPASFDTLFLPCCATVVREVSRFTEGREAYERLGTKWQKMIMLHGEPGCGKTSLIAAVARRFGRSPMFIPLHAIKTLAELVDQIECSAYEVEFAKSMIVLEEADTWAPICQKRTLHGSEGEDESDASSLTSLSSLTSMSSVPPSAPTSMSSVLPSAPTASSTSCADAAYVREKEKEARDNQLGILLNMFDGVRSYPGLLILMTTNRLDMFDPALIRPGRTTCIEVGRLAVAEVNATFRLYFGEDLPDDLLGNKMSVTLAELSWLRDYIGDHEGALLEFRRRFE